MDDSFGGLAHPFTWVHVPEAEVLRGAREAPDGIAEQPVGNSLIGWFLKNGLYGTLILLPVLMAVIAMVLIGFGDWVTPTAALLDV